MHSAVGGEFPEQFLAMRHIRWNICIRWTCVTNGGITLQEKCLSFLTNGIRLRLKNGTMMFGAVDCVLFDAAMRSE